MTTSTLQLVQYYANLLINQYQNQPRAFNTIITTVTPIVMAQQSVQTITFSQTPTSGTFVLSYNGNNTVPINWNDTSTTIQSDLQALPGLSSVTVSGSITSSSGLTINFIGLTQVAQLLILVSNSLEVSSQSVTIKIQETDLTLPLAIQNAFNINLAFGPTAVGVQLDILGKYAGVTRTISTPTQTIVLNDSDFITLIKFAVVQNNSGSSLDEIESNLNIFFPNDFIVIDYTTMYMSYIFSQSLGSPNLFSALIQEKLIPKPMGVQISVILPPIAKNIFGYSTYEQGGINTANKPYNTYEVFNNTWIYLDYKNIIY